MRSLRTTFRATTILLLSIGRWVATTRLGIANAECNAPAEESTVRNPVARSPESLERGETLYQQQCYSCHGSKGHGDGPASVALVPRPAALDGHRTCDQSDGELMWEIAQGRPPMPPFGPTLSKAQIGDLVNLNRNSRSKP